MVEGNAQLAGWSRLTTVDSDMDLHNGLIFASVFLAKLAPVMGCSREKSESVDSSDLTA